MGNSRGSASRAQKIAAVAAAGVVLLGGATITSLAAWTDNEYVVGGFDDQPGIGTSTFEVEQNTIEPAAWAQHEEVVGPYGVVDFGLGALSLSPGASVAGWVQLRTTVDTDVDGTVTLEGAFDDDNSSPELFAALTYGAAIVATPADCDVDLVFTEGNTIAAQGSALSADGANTFDIIAAAHPIVNICFVVTMDDDAPDTLQGETTSPVWNFHSLSD